MKFPDADIASLKLMFETIFESFLIARGIGVCEDLAGRNDSVTSRFRLGYCFLTSLFLLLGLILDLVEEVFVVEQVRIARRRSRTEPMVSFVVKAFDLSAKLSARSNIVWS